MTSRSWPSDRLHSELGEVEEAEVVQIAAEPCARDVGGLRPGDEAKNQRY